MALGHDLPPQARLFPLQRNSKRPAIKDWPRLATDDPNTLDKWFKHTFKGHNAAVATGNGLMVLDVDTKADGLASLDLLDLAGLPTSYRVKTPSGGVHVYLKVNEPVSNSVNRLDGYPGIDVRGENGYVVAAGSTYDGKPYVAAPGPIEPAPDWIVELARKRRHENTNDGQPQTELDTPHNLTRAADYLKAHAGQAIAGEGGNDHTFKVAARVREFGVSEGEALQMLLDWNQSNEPPWDYEDLERITANAYQYATAQWGGASGLAEFEPVEILEKKEKRKRLYWERFVDAGDGALQHAAEPLIDDLLDTQSMTVVYGQSSSGKSFVVLDMAFHIASGLSWNGRQTKQGLVVYLAAEGGRGFRRRIMALQKTHSIRDVPLAVVPCPADLSKDNTKDMAQMLAIVKEAEEAYGQRCVLICIDTLSRVIVGGDENAPTDMGAFVKAAGRLGDEAKAAVAIIHHSGKDQARGARGHSLLRAATDTEIEIHENKIRVTKQRDMELLPEIKFKIENVQLGPDSRGKQRTGGVIKILTGNEFTTVEITPNAQAMLEALEHAIEAAGNEFATVKEWYAQYRENHASSCKITDRTLWTYRKELEESGRVKKLKHNQWVVVQLEEVEIMLTSTSGEVDEVDPPL
jgi:hypothetical protein